MSAERNPPQSAPVPPTTRVSADLRLGFAMHIELAFQDHAAAVSATTTVTEK